MEISTTGREKSKKKYAARKMYWITVAYWNAFCIRINYFILKYILHRISKQHDCNYYYKLKS